MGPDPLKPTAAHQRHVLLLGGGHAHVHVLRALAEKPLDGARVTLVTPFERQLYSGMVPGLVAGHYAADECSIPLEPLARAAGVPLVRSSVVAFDAAAQQVTLADGRTLDFDLASLDTGAVMHRDRLPGARAQGLFVRPIEHFVRLLDPLVALAAERVLDVVVIGGGAAGVELAMALQHRLCAQGEERARVALVTGGPPPLFGYPQAVIDRGRAALARCRVTVIPETAVAIEPGAVRLANGTRLACDAPVLATGAEAPDWLTSSGLALDERGFVQTGPTLQSTSHERVFAVGDVATRVDAPHPKSGVFAVRAGPPLVENLRRAVAGSALAPYTPQRRTLNLISCGRREAIASWGDWSAQGRWVWWWKNRIDRAFIQRYTQRMAAPRAHPPADAGM